MINPATKSQNKKPEYLKPNNDGASVRKPEQKKSQHLTALKKIHLDQNNYAKKSDVLNAAMHNAPENIMQFQDISEIENKEIKYFSSLKIDFSTNTLDHSNQDNKSNIGQTLGKSPSNATTAENMHSDQNGIMQTPYLSQKEYEEIEYLISLNIYFSTSGIDHSNPNKISDIEPTLGKSPTNATTAENMHNDKNDLMLSKAFQEIECEEMEFSSSPNTDMIAILHDETKKIDIYKSNINTEKVYKKDKKSFTSAAEPGQLIASPYIDQHTTLDPFEIDFYSTFFTQYDNASQTPSITSSSDINTPPTPDWGKNSSQSK